MKKRYKPNNQFRYEIKVKSWDVYVSFNDYSYINIFDSPPFAEKAIFIINGVIEETTSKKIKKGKVLQIAIHSDDDWYKPVSAEQKDDPIGELVISKEYRKGDSVIARVSIPTKSYELIRSYLSYKVAGNICLTGTELLNKKADIFHFKFNSQKAIE